MLGVTRKLWRGMELFTLRSTIKLFAIEVISQAGNFTKKTTVVQSSGGSAREAYAS